MRFLIDMNLSPKWVEFLTNADHEATHWVDIGAPDAPDQEVLAYASSRSLVILTQDLDFGTLLAVGGLSTPSVIQFRAQAVLPNDIGSQLLAALAAADPYLIEGALVTVESGTQRITVLPLSQ
ncbi:MAG: DUF5615 family PIN-like protein [Frankiaceae bacterium]